MILACPACKTRFEIDATRLGSKGRLVRCGQCAHAWRQTGEIDGEIDEVVPPPEAATLHTPETQNAPAREPAKQPSMPPGPAPEEEVEFGAPPNWGAAQPSRAPTGGRTPESRMGWLLLLAFVAGLVAFAYFGRDQLVARIPPISGLYALAGWSVNLPEDKLSLENVTSVRRLMAGDRVLIIEGEVLNASDSIVSVPTLRAVLHDAEGGEISSWSFSAEDRELGPGESTRFETSTRNPPKTGKDLSITLTGGG